MNSEKEGAAMNESTNDLLNLNAKEAWEVLYGKELTTKKNILEYIELLKVLRQDNIPVEKIQENYNFVYKAIDDLGGTIKVNTKLYLKNQLKAQLGKLVKEKDPKPINYFIEFFKEAYPENNRRKDFTWVLMDINKITDEQIWNTLTYINSWILKEENNLNENQKKDTIKMIELLVKRNNIRYINNTRSLEKLLTSLNIKIVSIKDKFTVKFR